VLYVNLTPTVVLLDAIVQVLTSEMQTDVDGMKNSDKVSGVEPYVDPYTYAVVMAFDLPLAGAAMVLTSPLHSFWVKVAVLETTLMSNPAP